MDARNKKHLWPAVFYCLLTLGLLYGLCNKWGPVPPAGPFFSPYAGYVNLAEPLSAAPDSAEVPTKNLKAPLRVLTDSNLVHSIFAQNLHDLYYAQGYLTARQRLWQMEFQTFAAAGRLSELIGEKAIEYDKFQRRFGMVWAAEKALDSAMHDPETAESLTAYADGVNAYISGLSPKDFPLEYRLLDYGPEPWSPLKSALLLKYMAFDLSGHSEDMYMSNIAQKLGKPATDSLFPDRAPNPDPIIPRGTKWDFTAEGNSQAITGTKPQAQSAAGHLNQGDAFQPEMSAGIGYAYAPGTADYENIFRTSRASQTAVEAPAMRGFRANPANGSNNWAVSGRLTKSGFPVLANDPHLGLNLPSLWYTVQLSAPGFNCAGVSLPGAPGIVIGFNDSLAWGVTNTGADVLDFYAMDIPMPKTAASVARAKVNAKMLEDAKNTDGKLSGEDAKAKQAQALKADEEELRRLPEPPRPRFYRDGAGKLQPLQLRAELIKVRGSVAVYDTVCMAPMGPVSYLPGEKPFRGDVPAGYAVRWAAHDAGNELRTFLRLNKARNFQEFNEALRTYNCPAQNFAYADAAGNIAMRCMGSFPNRKAGQGKYLLNGNRPEDAWPARIPEGHNPMVLNPPRGFVSSANQSPTDSTYPYFLGADFAANERGRRINMQLKALTDSGARIDAADMGRLQTDAFSLHAQAVLPLMLRFANIPDLTPPQRSALSDLGKWNYIFSADTKAAELFNLWWERMMHEIWEPVLGGGDYTYPGRELTVRMVLSDTANRRYDNPATPKREYLRQVVQAAFLRAWQQRPSPVLPKGDNLQWGNRKGTGLRHLARLAPLSRLNLYCGGAKGTINALSDDHGPSWRMAVQTGPNPFMLCIYPGGQSGNPGSPFYDNFVEDWRKGRLRKIGLRK